MNNPFNVNNKFKIAWDGSFNINDKFKVDAGGNVNINDKLYIDNDGNIEINRFESLDETLVKKQWPTFRISNDGSIGINYKYKDYDSAIDDYVLTPIIALNSNGTITVGQRDSTDIYF
jgi:antitoxin component YwqK of YwqJK toxin-antitoxin module